MSQMQQAFADAERVKQAQAQQQPSLQQKPATERIWLWLRDHPRSSSADLKKVHGGHASMTIQALMSRGMVVYEEKFIPETGRMRRYYSVEPKMRGVYELWPEIKEKKEKRKANRAAETAAPVASEQQAPAQPPASAILTAAKLPDQPARREKTPEIPACLQNVPMQEALEAYKYLKTLFG